MWVSRLCFLINTLEVLCYRLCKKVWEKTRWPHHLEKNTFVLHLTASLANSQFGCSEEGEVAHWKCPTWGIQAEGSVQGYITSPSCQARSPVGIRQSCCPQLCPHESSLPVGQRGRKVPAAPPFQHLMEERGGFTHHLPLCLKYFTEVKPVSHNSDQAPVSLFIRETGRVVEAVSETSKPHFVLRRGQEMGSNTSKVFLCHCSSSHLHPCSLYLQRGAWETLLLFCFMQILILPLSEAFSFFLFENSFQAFWTSLQNAIQIKKSYFPLLDFLPAWLWVHISNASIDRDCRNPLSSCKSSQPRNPLGFSSRTCRVLALNI